MSKLIAMGIAKKKNSRKFFFPKIFLTHYPGLSCDINDLAVRSKVYKVALIINSALSLVIIFEEGGLCFKYLYSCNLFI